MKGKLSKTLATETPRYRLTTTIAPCSKDASDFFSRPTIADLDGNPITDKGDFMNTGDWCSAYFGDMFSPMFGSEICVIIFTLFVFMMVIVVVSFFALHVLFRKE